MKDRFHNIVFGIIVGCVFGVTVWTLYIREPDLFRDVIRNPVATENITTVDQTNKQQNVTLSVEEERPRNKVDAFIEAGKLSDHEAKYYKKINNGK